MASRPVWSRNRPQITWRCRMACFYDVFDAYSTEKWYKPALAGRNNRGTWCLIQFTSTYRWPSQGVVWWFGILASRCGSASSFSSCCSSRSNTTRRFRILPFSWIFSSQAKDSDFPGRKMKDDSVHPIGHILTSTFKNVFAIFQSNQTVNQRVVYICTLFIVVYLIHFDFVPWLQDLKGLSSRSRESMFLGFRGLGTRCAEFGCAVHLLMFQWTWKRCRVAPAIS